MDIEAARRDGNVDAHGVRLYWDKGNDGRACVGMPEAEVPADAARCALHVLAAHEYAEQEGMNIVTTEARSLLHVLATRGRGLLWAL